MQTCLAELASCVGWNTCHEWLIYTHVRRFQNDFDGTGLMHYLSTNGGKDAYTNTCLSGAVVCDSSGWMTDLHHGKGHRYLFMCGLFVLGNFKRESRE
jgi:hypothetical protein